MEPTTALPPSAMSSSGAKAIDHRHDDGPMRHGSYARFGAMITTSTTIMLVLMYSLVYRLDHVWFANTRFLMALYMGAMMTAVMLLFMLSMYRNKVVNGVIFTGAAVVFAGALYLARSQVLIGDVAYMKAMIPHHSIAIRDIALSR